MANKAVFKLDGNGFPTQVKLSFDDETGWVGMYFYAVYKPVLAGQKAALDVHDRNFKVILDILEKDVDEVIAVDADGNLVDYAKAIACARAVTNRITISFTTETLPKHGVLVLETVLYFGRQQPKGV